MIVQGFADEELRVSVETFADDFARQRVGVVLANATELRPLTEQFFEAPLIFDQLGEVLFGAEFLM